MSQGIGRCPVFLLEVALSTGGNATSITVKGSNWGDYFIYDNINKKWMSFSNQIIIGDHSSSTVSSTSMGIGARAGYAEQSATATAIGQGAGNANQGDDSVAVGQFAGVFTQKGIVVGTSAAQSDQLPDAVAIGHFTGLDAQKGIAIGANAGQYSQQTGAIAIGYNAGQYSQATGAIAIGTNAGQTNQSTNSIAIGYNAGSSSLSCQSIVIDASFSIPINAGATGVFIRPVMGPKEGSNFLSWNTETKEIFYNGSSQRYKYDIQDLPMSGSLSKSSLSGSLSIDKLQPREFKYKLDNSPDIGLIAEEAYICDNAFAYLDHTEIPEGIQWNAITVALVKELQQMKKRIQILRTNNTQQIKI
jgi:hypothetical protein